MVHLYSIREHENSNNLHTIHAKVAKFKHLEQFRHSIESKNFVLPPGEVEQAVSGFPWGKLIGQKHCPTPLVDLHSAFGPQTLVLQPSIELGGQVQPPWRDGSPVQPGSHLKFKKNHPPIIQSVY